MADRDVICKPSEVTMAKALPVELRDRIVQRVTEKGLTLAAAADLYAVGTATVQLLPDLVAKSPSDYGWTRSTWSVALIALEVQRQLGTEVSRLHMGRMLPEAGCRRIRPRASIALTPPDADEQVAALHAELDHLPDTDVILYEDEVDMHLNPKPGPD